MDYFSYFTLKIRAKVILMVEVYHMVNLNHVINLNYTYLTL
jgi:hypothetical protein